MSPMVVLIAALLVEQLQQGVTIDWKQKSVEVAASCAADFRAPSVEVARIKAERVARERARERIAEALSALPKSRWSGPQPSREALLLATEQAELVRIDYGSNGSVSLRLRLLLQASTLSLLPPRKHK